MEMENQRLYILKRFFPDWTDKFGIDDLLDEFGKASLAILYSGLFLPDLRECQGSILLAWSISSNETEGRFRAAKEQAKSEQEIEELESSFNFLEIGTLFQPAGRDTLDAEDDFLASLIAEAWRNLLCRQYFDRTFIVEVVSAEVTGGSVGVHFYERRVKGP